MKKILIAGLALAFSTSSFNARAEWMTKVEDDLFSGGKEAMLTGSISPMAGIVFDCTKNSLSMAYIEKDLLTHGHQSLKLLS